MSKYTNPVGTLIERFQSRGIVPIFTLIQAGGSPHCPTFTFQVDIPEFSATGSGSTKKGAKQAAAKALLSKLDSQEEKIAELISSETSKPEESQMKQEMKNPVGELQEFCVRHGLPLPRYDVTGDAGPPHQRAFYMNAQVALLSSSGTGASKKEAKKLAAKSMLSKLLSLEKDFSSIYSSSPKESHEKKSLDKKGLSQQFCQSLKCHPLLQSLSLRSRKGNYVIALEDLSRQLKFGVNFFCVEEPTTDGEIECLIQLTTVPSMICCSGIGSEQAEAKEDAARNALKCLKLVTKIF